MSMREKRYLVVLQRSRVQGPAQKELGYHTTQRPHVYGLTKWQAQNNLWSPAETKERHKADQYHHQRGKQIYEHTRVVKSGTSEALVS